MMNKTAVDTIIEFMKNSQYFIGNDLVKACSLAKELEKQQIIDAYWAGINGTMNDYSEAKLEGSFVKGIKISDGAYHYYNETYKQE